jgi:hypothetical protein
MKKSALVALMLVLGLASACTTEVCNTVLCVAACPNGVSPTAVDPHGDPYDCSCEAVGAISNWRCVTDGGT